MAKSSSVAAADVGQRPPGWPRRPAARPRRAAAATAGRKASATSRWTSSVSAALHTPGRWVLALTTIGSAMSRSAAAST